MSIRLICKVFFLDKVINCCIGEVTIRLQRTPLQSKHGTKRNLMSSIGQFLMHSILTFKKIKCIHGCIGTGTTEKQDVKLHSYCWSPMICIDHKVWVYHQRLICNCCKKSFTTINPKFMSQLPTRVTERFPFFTSSRGAGIHQTLVLQFVSLVGTGVIFGSYVKSINELQQIKYVHGFVFFLFFFFSPLSSPLLSSSVY